MNGWYDFGNVATDQTYQLKISGPGIRTRSKEIEIKYVPGRIGNIDYYIPVERSADTVAFRPVETYRPKQIAPDARTIEDLYSHIPGITYEDGYLTDENGATVCLMFSGIIPDEAGYAAILTNLTADNIERIEYYRLDNLEEPYYDGVLNFVTVGVNFNAPSIKEQLTPSPVANYNPLPSRPVFTTLFYILFKLRNYETPPTYPRSSSDHHNEPGDTAPGANRPER